MQMLFLGLMLLVPLAPQDEAVKEFKKYYKSFKEKAQKIEAILALSGHDNYEVVKALLPVMKTDDYEIYRAALKILAACKTPGAVEELINGARSKSGRSQVGAIEALGMGKHQAAVEQLIKLTGKSKVEVKSAAAIALGRIGDTAATPSVVELLGDGKEEVKIAACDGLGFLADPSSADAVIEKLKDNSWRVRASAIKALGGIRATQAVGALVKALQEEEGRLMEDAAKSLEGLTGNTWGADIKAWVNWWDNVKDSYNVPSAAELKAYKERMRKASIDYGILKVPKFTGISTASKHILFVIDISGSMEDEVLDRKRFEGKNYTKFTKMEIVKQELLRTIQSLDSNVYFNILTFATQVKSWKKAPVPADILHKKSAESFVSGLKAIGGKSASRLAGAGLYGAAGIEEGKTNTCDALMSFIGGPMQKPVGKNVARDIDTVFFLSDGRPSTGELIAPDDILAAVKEINELKKIVIHAIAIGEFQKNFMEDLANQNGGVFVDLGE